MLVVAVEYLAKSATALTNNSNSRWLSYGLVKLVSLLTSEIVVKGLNHWKCIEKFQSFVSLL